MPTTPSRAAARAAAVAAGLLGAVLLAGPALAHVQVVPAKAEAGASDVVLHFSAEAESPSAGIKSLRVVLPAGIAPADVRLVSGPAGWRMRATTDGYQLAGAALPTGKDAAWAVTVRKLPDATAAVFKTLVTYANGAVDRWIEVPPAGGPEPANPAPVLILTRPKGAPATTAPAPTSAPTSPPSTQAASAAPAAEGGGATWTWVALAVAVVAAAIIGLRLARRSRGRP